MFPDRWSSGAGSGNKIDHLVEIIAKLVQGLEGYFRDPGFDQNTVRDPGKRKIY